MLHSLRSFQFALIATFALAACASSGPSGSTAPVTGALQNQTGRTPDAQLITANDHEADCKTLRGRMQIKILDLNARARDQRSTGLSRAMQSSVSSVLGGPGAGTNPEAQTQRDVARLRALNQMLKARNCKAFDLEKQLSARTP